MKRLKLFLLPVVAFGWVMPQAQTAVLTDKVKAETVANIAKSLQENYVYLDTAKKMGSFILQQLKAGAYDTINSPQVFASRLTTDILSVYHDGHLSISYNAPSLDAGPAPGPKGENDRRTAFRRKVNFGWDKAEVLPGNIGYLKIGGFFAPDDAAKTMALAALRFVSNCDELIIDLRNNMGGSPDMVSYICGFFFEHKTHLNNLYTRRDNITNQYWAVPDTSFTMLNHTPIYLLTSHQTFSAGEKLCYDLKVQHRATIIGEATGGGAHPVQPFYAGNGFTANVPFAKAINPVTQTNWEAVGVQPDVKVSADSALNIALQTINHK